MVFSSTLLENAVNEFAKLPGIGKKTALRLVLHLLKKEVSDTESFTQALLKLREEIYFCVRCHNISDRTLCNICSDRSRKQPRHLAPVIRPKQPDHKPRHYRRSSLSVVKSRSGVRIVKSVLLFRTFHRSEDGEGMAACLGGRSEFRAGRGVQRRSHQHTGWMPRFA